MEHVSVREMVRPSTFEGIPVVDVDTHITEWPDLWTSRAPASFKDRVPQLKKVGDDLKWMVDGDKPIGIPCNHSCIRRDGSKAATYAEFIKLSLDEIYEASYDVKARVNYMNDVGITAQIGYPNILGFGGQHSYRLDPQLRLVCTEIYNDAMAEMQAESGNRMFPMAMLPWWDLKESLAEVERCRKLGLRGVIIHSDPHELGLPDLSESHWSPLWEVLSDYKLPVNFHIGGSDASSSWFREGNWPSLDANQRLAFGSAMIFLGNAGVISNIVLSGVLERFPELKIVSVESGAGWVPFMLEALEYQMQQVGINYSISPQELFQRQIYACSWFEQKNFVATARAIGVDNVMWETDFPHPTCLYPNPLDVVAPTAEQFTPEERYKVFGGNANRLYNLGF